MGRLLSRKGLIGVGQDAIANSYRFNSKIERKLLWKPQEGGQTMFYNTRADICIYGGSAGCGKAQPCLSISKYLRKGHKFMEVCYNLENGIFEVDEMEQTVLDWKGEMIPMSLIKVGDRIMNPDGQFQEVLEIFDRGFLKTYEVTFEDGTKVECCGEHLWSFWEARANSRKKSKAEGFREVYSNLTPEGWNKNYITRVRVRNTLWLKEALEKGRKLLIPVNAPLNFTQISRGNAERAYVYGVMIGDGCFSRKEFCGHIDDKFIYDEVNRIAEGEVDYSLYPSKENIYTAKMKKVEWFNNWVRNERFSSLKSNEKKLPKNFQKASLEYRYGLAQGLFDTDGYVAENCREVSFTTVSEQLANDVCTLVRTLGYLAKIYTKENSGYKNKEGEFIKCQVAYTVRVEGNDLELLFRLPRKVERAKALGDFNNGKSWVGKAIVSIEEKGEEFCRCIKVSNPNSVYITTDYNVTHNSSALLMDCANMNYLKTKGYNATIFRRSFPQITNPGGLLDESRMLYEDIGGKLKLNPLDWRFETGSKISFRHIQYDKSIYDYQGAQICKLGFDELTHFTEEIFFYMLSRNRSGCGIRPTVRATCNPDADSWVASFIEWWIDQETGLPIKDRRGKLRYFIRREDETIWADSEEELRYIYGDDVIAKSATFIYGTIEDNKKLLEKDPNYIANLQALHPVEKARLLYGNWKARFEAGAIFDRHWFTVIKEIPDNERRGIKVRFWDMAATAKDTASKQHELNKAFYTANMKMHKIGDSYYITDVKWQRIKGGQIEQWLIDVAQEDGEEVRIRWELEGGSAAKIVAESFREKLLNDNGEYDVRAIKPQGDKVTRALKVASCASRGEIFVLEREWTNKFLNAVQDFDGSRKPLTNDIVDCLSGCFNELEKAVDYIFTDDNMTGFNNEYSEDSFYRSRQ